MAKSFTYFFSTGLLALFLTLGVSAQQPKLVFPSTPFNKAETMASLEPGNSTLKGSVNLSKRDRGNLTGALKVTLFPCTPYFQEYYELRKRHRGKNTLAAMSSEAFSYRIETHALNQDGSFEFPGLKPGKYFLSCDVTVGKMGHYDVQTGTEYETTTTTINGNPIGQYTEEIPIYTKHSYIYSSESQKSKFAEIKNDNQVVEVEL